MTDYIDQIIDFAWASGADIDFVNHAKQELKDLISRVNSYEVVAWAKTNDYGDLYDLRLHYNPYDNLTDKIELYRRIN